MSVETTQDADLEQIRNTPPSRLVVMLYDAIIAALESAIESIEDGDIAKRCRCVNVAIEVTSYLYMSLDMEKGGIIAENLSKLYRFVIIELPKINRDNDPAIARAIIGLLQPLHQSWIQLDSALNEPVAVPVVPLRSTRGRARNKARASA